MVRRFGIAAAVPVLLVGGLLAGCGSSPADSGQAAGSSGGNTLDAVYKAVDGLSGQQRYDKLLQLAKAAGGHVSLYHAAAVDDLVKAFQDKTGLTVDDFKATSERVAERVNDEHKAGKPGSDVVILSVDDLLNLKQTGSLGALHTPALDEVPADFKTDGVVGLFGIEMMPTYNTHAVKKTDLPKSWTDFFTSFHARKAIEQTDWFWYEAMVEKYFVAKKGMTEQAAMDLITNGLKGASIVDGHTLVANLLASGQYDYVPNVMANYTVALQKKGAPVSWDGLAPDMPPAIVTMVSSVVAGSPDPAGALLFEEFALSKAGQDALAGMDYVPLAKTYDGKSLLQQYPETIRTDDVTHPRSKAEQDKWQAAFDKLLQSIGGQRLSGNK